MYAPDRYQIGETLAIELVEHLKRVQATELEIPAEDEAGTWLVTVRRIRFEAEDTPTD